VFTDSKACPSGGACTGSNNKRCPAKVDIGFAIGSIMRLQVPRVRVENGWAPAKFAGGFAQARRLTLGSSNLVYFCEPTLRTQLHMSVCGTYRTLRDVRVESPLRGEADMT
jgi:hypothetical protein